MSETLTKGPIPTIGRIVHYTLTAQNAVEIMRRRTDGASIFERLRSDEGRTPTWPRGAQAHQNRRLKMNASKLLDVLVVIAIVTVVLVIGVWQAMAQETTRYLWVLECKTASACTLDDQPLIVAPDAVNASVWQREPLEKTHFAIMSADRLDTIDGPQWANVSVRAVSSFEARAARVDAFVNSRPPLHDQSSCWA